MDKIQLVILCGGEGTRVKHITQKVPKCMYSVGGGPFLFYILRHFAQYVKLIDSFVLCCSDKSTEIKQEMVKFFKKGGMFKGTELEDEEDILIDDLFYEDLPIYWATEPKPFGTLAGMVSALPHIKTEFVLVMNGDTFCPVKLDELLMTDYNNFIITALIHESRNTGVWLVKSSLLSLLGEDTYVLNKGLPREVLLEGWTSGEVTFTEGPPYIDMGTPEGLAQAKKELKR